MQGSDELDDGEWKPNIQINMIFLPIKAIKNIVFMFELQLIYLLYNLNLKAESNFLFDLLLIKIIILYLMF